jgi:hypothetical protein
MEGTRTKVKGADYEDRLIYSFSSEDEFVESQMQTKTLAHEKADKREQLFRGIYKIAMAKKSLNETVEEVKEAPVKKSKKPIKKK